MTRTPVYLSVFCLFSALSMGALQAAEPPAVLADPTLPPFGVASSMEGAGAGSTGLRSVILPKKGPASAVIDGQLVPVGGRVGEARLVRVTETEAVLEGPEGVERLYLTPDVDKKMSVTKGAARRQKDKP